MNPQLTTHATLLKKLSEGSDAAWHEFYDRYGELIRNVARRQGLQAADCDDIMQEVLIGLSRRMPGFEYDPARGKFRSYLKTLVTRAVYKRFRQKPLPTRQQTVEAAPVEGAGGSTTEQVWEDEWRAYHLRQAMHTIETEFNPPERAAFEMYAIDGRDAQDTAEALGISIDRVYQAKSRILRRLTALIEVQVREEG